MPIRKAHEVGRWYEQSERSQRHALEASPGERTHERSRRVIPSPDRAVVERHGDEACGEADPQPPPIAPPSIDRDLPGTHASDHRCDQHATRPEAIGDQSSRRVRTHDAVERPEGGISDVEYPGREARDLVDAKMMDIDAILEARV